jgi:hypothetical protein
VARTTLCGKRLGTASSATDAVARSFSKFPAVLLDGHIMLGVAVLSNEIPIPLSRKGIVEHSAEILRKTVARMTLGLGLNLSMLP